VLAPRLSVSIAAARSRGGVLVRFVVALPPKGDSSAESSLKYTRACEYHIGSFDVSVTTGWPSGRPKRAAVTVRWSGSDPAGAPKLIPSGVRRFDLYMRRGKGRYRRIRRATRKHSAKLRLKPGVYRFYTRATDAAHNLGDVMGLLLAWGAHWHTFSRLELGLDGALSVDLARLVG